MRKNPTRNKIWPKMFIFNLVQNRNLNTRAVAYKDGPENIFCISGRARKFWPSHSYFWHVLIYAPCNQKKLAIFAQKYNFELCAVTTTTATTPTPTDKPARKSRWDTNEEQTNGENTIPPPPMPPIDEWAPPPPQWNPPPTQPSG